MSDFIYLVVVYVVAIGFLLVPVVIGILSTCLMTGRVCF